MNSFEYIKATTTKQAIDLMNSTVPEAMVEKTAQSPHIVKAGGTDLLDLIKEGILQPDRIIDLSKIPGLDKLFINRGGSLNIGALATIADLENNKEVAESYRALQLSAAHAATPQLRNMATMGGNLMQRPRCWYFRSQHHPCRKKGGDICFARKGENKFHAIFETESCCCVHPSSLATALVAFDGKVELAGPDGTRTVPLSEFFTSSEGENVTMENTATSKEIITNILLPPVDNNTRSFYIKSGQRESYDWSTGDVAVVLKMDGDKCKDARIVLGAAAPMPLRMTAAEKVLIGKKISEKLAKKAAEKAMEEATPLEQNKYKVALFKTLIERTILGAMA